MFKFISNAFEKVQNFFGYESSRQKEARENIRKELEAQKWEQKEKRGLLARWLMYHLISPIKDFQTTPSSQINEVLHSKSTQLKEEVLQRFQAEVLELCKKTLDSHIKSDEDKHSSVSFREKNQDNHSITSLLTSGKNIKDALDEEEKGKIVKYLEEQCKKVKHWVPEHCSVRKDLKNIGLLPQPGLAEWEESDLGKIANNAFYKGAGDEFLKKYLEAQVYNVILGEHYSNTWNTYAYVQKGTIYITPRLLAVYYIISAFDGYSQESDTYREIEKIKSALGDEEFKKWVSDIIRDFESKRPGFDAKMSKFCTKFEITNVDELKNQIDKNIKVIKEFAGIGEQKQWANFAQQNNSQILQLQL
jgi:hypothetical protein